MADKTKIFALGITGLVGSRIVSVLQDKYDFTGLGTQTGVDITQPETLSVIREDTTHPIVLHLAAKADVDGCEQDKPLGEEGAAFKINVLGTQNVVDACKVANKKLIYISTDFVFDGENPPQGGYTEEDTPHPVNWYAETKYMGEERVRASDIASAIVRIAYPYRADVFPAKKDFVHAIMGRLQNSQPIAGVTDHYFQPTFIDDIAYAIAALIAHDATGTYHVTGSQRLTPYDAALLIAELGGFDSSLIHTSKRENYFKDKAKRPFDLSVNNAKIERLGIHTRTFKEGLQEIFKH